MRTEKSCGAVVFTREHGEIKFIINKSKTGYYGFPKGHMEEGETENETALREIKEETGLGVLLIEGFREKEEYNLIKEGKPDVKKEVIYFLGEYSMQKFVNQDSEVSEIMLLSFEEALKRLCYDAAKKILKKAAEYIKTLN